MKACVHGYGYGHVVFGTHIFENCDDGLDCGNCLAMRHCVDHAQNPAARTHKYRKWNRQSKWAQRVFPNTYFDVSLLAIHKMLCILVATFVWRERERENGARESERELCSYFDRKWHAVKWK